MDIIKNNSNGVANTFIYELHENDNFDIKLFTLLVLAVAELSESVKENFILKIEILEYINNITTYTYSSIIWSNLEKKIIKNITNNTELTYSVVAILTTVERSFILGFNSTEQIKKLFLELNSSENKENTK